MKTHFSFFGNCFKKYIIFIGILILFSFKSSYSQQLVPYLVSSAGGDLNASSIGINFSIGEVVVGAFATPSVKLTQGFQQSYIIIPKLVNNLKSYNINTYPNPVMDNLNIEISNYPQNEKCTMKIIDALGRIVQMPWEQNHQQNALNYNVNFSNVAVGTYYILLFDLAKGEKLAEFKIIKIYN